MIRAAAVAVAVLAAACKSSAPPSPPAAAFASEEVSFTVGDHAVPGTLVHPTAAGRHPAVVLMAGSGPTDRDWNSPMLAAKNGSAKLLAEELARRGAVVLRFDKAAVGGNHAALATITLDTYRDEGRGALALVRARPDVDPARLYIAGHSEGAMHATRVALEEGRAIAGLLLLSGPGRTMKDVLITQLGAQLRDAAGDPAAGDAAIAKLREELDGFVAGGEPSKRLASLGFVPQIAPLGRALLAFDPAAAVAKVDVPVLVLNGMHDIQVDPELDAKPLAAARAGKPTTLLLAPEADHVLKHEPKSVGELRENMLLVEARYNATDRVLDAAVVDAIAKFLALSPSRS